MHSGSVLPPTSELRFRHPDGARCEPSEWKALLLELPGSVEPWSDWRVSVNGESRPVVQRRLGREIRCVCEWPRSAAGHYRVALEHPVYGSSRHEISLAAAKLGEGALESLLTDLEHLLPYGLAAALQRGGALAGLELKAPSDVSPAAELARLRQLVEGGPNGPGIVAVLGRIALDPHRVLVETDLEVPQDRARRSHPILLRRAMYRQRQIDVDGRPLRLEDRRVEPTYDTYENRLLKLVVETCRRRLLGLTGLIRPSLRKEPTALIEALERASRQAHFLGEVGMLDRPPDDLTQVQVHRSGYRRCLHFWRLLSAGLGVRLRAVALETPFQSVPDLYELWATWWH